MKKITDWWDRCLERHLCHSRSLILEAGLSTGTVSFPVRLLGSLLAQITLPDTAEELIYSRNFASSFWSHKVFIHTYGHMPEHSRRPRPTGQQSGHKQFWNSRSVWIMLSDIGLAFLGGPVWNHLMILVCPIHIGIFYDSVIHRLLFLPLSLFLSFLE